MFVRRICFNSKVILSCINSNLATDNSIKRLDLQALNYGYERQQRFTLLSCHYAKGKDRSKKDNKHKVIKVDENVLSQAVDSTEIRNQMDKVINRMKEDFVKHFSLRSSAGALETLPVEFEGTEYTLQDVAQIGKKTANMYVVSLASFPQLIPAVTKSIQESGLGLNPQQDGTTLFIPIPKVTKEHRETLSKNAKAVFIKARDSLRDVQNKFIKTAKSKEGLSEDVFYSIKEQVTSIADQRISEADALLKAKQEELKG